MTSADGHAVRVGLTLPSFQSEPDKVLAVARAAEDAGLDGVFLFDHLFRRRGDASDAERRPALELLTMTAAVGAATTHISVGTLVARATLRPPAVVRAAFDTLARIAPGRVIAGIGAGDDESIAEDTAFGVRPFPTLTNPDIVRYRVARFEETVAALADRSYPVWVAGTSPVSIRLAENADGWNTWGGTPSRFAVAAGKVRNALAAAGRDPAGFAFTWGGLAVVAPTQAQAEAKWERLGGGRPGIVRGDPAHAAAEIAAYASAGADWVILGPIDSADPTNADVLGEAARLLR